MIKTIGVLTSGGDAPGMNAAIRAVVELHVSSASRFMLLKEVITALWKMICTK